MGKNKDHLVVDILGVKHLIVEDKRYMDEDGQLGLSVKGASFLAIHPDMDEQQKLITLYHEILHKWNDYIMGGKLKERDCEALAVAMYQLHIKNKNIIDIINYVRDEYELEIPESINFEKESDEELSVST